MDADRFDAITRTLSTVGSRRGALTGLIGGALAGLLGLEAVSAARRRVKKGGGKGKKGEKKGGVRKHQTKSRKKLSVAKAAKNFILCHDGETITVGKKAKKKHLRHGDTLGECVSPPPPPPQPFKASPPTSLPTSPPTVPPPAACRRTAQGCGAEPNWCMRCSQTQTVQGETVCAEDICTDVACESDQDCLAELEFLNPGETFCQAAGTGCCGQTCLVACGLGRFVNPGFSDCIPQFLAQSDANSGCTWDVGSGNADATCSDDRHCCHTHAQCHDEGYCCRGPFGFCQGDDECCNGSCTNSQCCNAIGETCAGDLDCCNNNCPDGTCCQNVRESCSADSDCCDSSATCPNGTCCLPTGGPCIFDGDCCEGTCGAQGCLPPSPPPPPTCVDAGGACIDDQGESLQCCLNSFCNVAGVCQCDSAPGSQCGGSFGSCCGGGSCDENGFCV